MCWKNAVMLKLVACFSCFTSVYSQADWTYGGGSSSWPDNYPACGGLAQSPIDITAPFSRRRPPTGNWVNYNTTPSALQIGNDGKIVYLQGTSLAGQKPQLRFSPRRIFELDHVEFHWGKTDATGSEHALNGKVYPMEMYAVLNRVIGGVIVQPSEQFIISTLFQTSTIVNRNFESFITYLPIIKNPGTSLNIPVFSWELLIPALTSSIFTYRGSMTVPPCTESVIYFIRTDIENIAKTQLAAFRQVLNAQNAPMSGNFRPLQPRNSRNIYYVRTPTDHHDHHG